MIAELPFTQRSKVMPLFQRGHRLYCVYLALLKKDQGKVFVDDLSNPGAAIFVHPFFSIVAGDWKIPDAKKLLKKSPRDMVIFPQNNGWNEPIKSAFPGNLLAITRTRFAEITPDLKNLQIIKENIAEGYAIVAINSSNIDKLLETFKSAKGIIHLFWTRESFPKESFGYIAQDSEKNIVSVGIMGTPLHNKTFEIHVETDPDHRRKGLAGAVCAALIMEAANRGLIPLWDAANENSANMARKLGYKEEEKYEIYVPRKKALKTPKS